MYHTIEFAIDLPVNLEISAKQPLERLLIRQGARAKVQLKPYVVEAEGELIEVADLFFEDGTATRGVPFVCFTFVD
jgi:hypothetical protein